MTSDLVEAKGRQGCGKTRFCKILLPPELRDYYNDKLNFKNEFDLNIALTSFALINIDEFDKTTSSQQIVLKYLLSSSDVKFRPPYGKTIKQYRRYPSFIGTTNQQQPLVDPTGSRRFVCVGISSSVFDGVDKETCILYVPKGCVEKYRAANGWKDFKNIQEIGTGINSLIDNGHTFDIYNLQGRKIRSKVTSLEGLPKGVYIIHGQKVIK